jgi:hypothetical protein
MLTAGQTSFKAYQKVERLTDDLSAKTQDAFVRGQNGEDNGAEFLELMNKKSLAYQGMTAIMKLNQKSLQKVLDESR